jgi:hypothetical protein
VKVYFIPYLGPAEAVSCNTGGTSTVDGDGAGQQNQSDGSGNLGTASDNYRSKVVFRSPIWGTKSAQCALNAHCSNLFVFGKNYPNFD